MAKRTVAATRVAPIWHAGLALGAGLMLALAATQLRAEGTTIAHGISTFGDLKYPADMAHLAYVNPTAPKGGEMSIATFGTFDSFNPYSDKGNAAALSTAPYEDIMVATADEVGALYCLLCTTIEYPQDKSWVIVNLRDDVTFSDGTPMTAEDVKFTYDLFLEQGLLSFRTILAQYVAGVEILGPHQLKYTFEPESAARERIQMAMAFPVMSKAWFDKTGARLDESRMEPGIGSGPYVLDSYDAGRRVVWKRNPDYWGNAHPLNIGRNNFDKLRVEYFGDPTAAFEGFKAGEFLFRDENSSKIWATGYDFPARKKGWVVKAELPSGNPASGQAFVFNLRREKFQDPRVREAIGLMFNFEWSNETLFYGLYARINSFGENSDLAATGLPSADELALLEPLKDQLPPGVLDSEPVMAPVSGPSQTDRGNLRRAARLLDEAGWQVGDDGMRRNAQGQPLTVEILSDDPAFDRVNNPFIENLRALGVDASLSAIDPAQYTERTRKFDFDLITDQMAMGLEPGAGLKQVFGTDGVKDVFNTAGLSNPAVDALIDKVLAAKSRAELETAARALDRVLRALRFTIPQWYKDKHTVAYYDVYDHPETLPPYALGQLDFWWWNAEKAEKLKAAGAF